MYIITTVFLAAMVFSIHSLLLAYSSVDLPGSSRASDSYTTESLEEAFQSALESSQDCGEARDNVMELKGVVTGTISGGQDIRILGDVNCTPGGDWPTSGPDLILDVTIIRENSETAANLELNH
jgi:hypothetical protein